MFMFPYFKSPTTKIVTKDFSITPGYLTALTVKNTGTTNIIYGGNNIIKPQQAFVLPDTETPYSPNYEIKLEWETETANNKATVSYTVLVKNKEC